MNTKKLSHGEIKMEELACKFFILFSNRESRKLFWIIMITRGQTDRENDPKKAHGPAAGLHPRMRHGRCRYANTSITALPLSPTVKGRLLGDMTTSSTGSPRLQPMVERKSCGLVCLSATAMPSLSLEP